MTTPNPADTGSEEVVVASSRRLTGSPLGWGVVKHSRGDRLFRGLAEGSGALIVVLIAAIGSVPADARNPGAGAQPGQLLHLRRQLGHHEQR